jgi:serine/threonine-protein kinase
VSDTSLSDSEALSPSLARYVDQACNRFEVAWKGKQPPRIEAFLGDAEEPERSALLRELVQLDVYYRRSRGEDCRPEDYRTRFPQLDPAWLARALVAPLSAASRSSAPAAQLLPRDAGTSQARSSVGPDGPRPGSAPSRAGWIGRTIAHYQVEERLGAGGMGEVYRARDLALGRPAALKLLPEDFSPALRARLLREAWASARLQHPAIATFYEAGEHEGLAFIAMEYVAGQTLRARLRSGALPVEQALAVTACVLEALGHAHAAGLLHRDIKPENVMLTGERSAKLLDFGLAKDLLLATDPAPATAVPAGTPAARSPAVPDPDATSDEVADTSAPVRPDRLEALTQSGALIGTIGYMSPEQVRGEALDARSDLFVVAAVLYEMLTGRRAFPRATANERIAAILAGDLPRLSGPGFPPGLEAVLARALDRDRARRYPSAGAFLADLHRLEVAGAVAALPDTLAILDFQDLSDDPSAGWLGSGIADSVAAHLAHVPNLSVFPRPQVVQAQAALGGANAVAALRDLGLRLGCRWLLSGSFHKSATALRVTARLIEVTTGQVVADEQLEGTLEQVFEMQRRLAVVVVTRLLGTWVWMAPEIPSATTPNLEAYECCARGYLLLQRGEKGSQERAQELFERAVSLEPGYARALAGLAGLHTLRFNYTTDPQTLEVAADYARRAIDADPHLSQAHVWLGYLYTRQGKVLEAYEQERKAMELDPSNPMAPYFAGAQLLTACRRDALELHRHITGQPDAPDLHRWRRREALKLAQRAVDLFPLFSSTWVPLGLIHLELGSRAEARWCLERAVELERQSAPMCFRGVAGYLGECLRRCGDLDEARRCCLAGLEAIEKTDNMFRDSSRGSYLCSLGRTALQQDDREAAGAAFRQAVLHLRGRPRAIGGGHALVQALAGLAQTGEGDEPFEEALHLFERREGFDFRWVWFCTDDISLLELARAARALGRRDQARNLLAQALDAGSTEALTEAMP